MDSLRVRWMREGIAIGAGLALLSTMLLPAEGRAEFFLRAHGGWLDIRGGRYNGVGQDYRGGLGGSGEIGFFLTRSISISAEATLPYDQPPKNGVDAVRDVDGSDYRMILGNVRFEFERIEMIRPYLILGGGQGIYSFDYADTGKVIRSGNTIRKLPNDRLKTWSGIAGLGFDAPLSGRLDWGMRARYIYNRWQSTSDMGILYAFPKGDGFAADVNLKLRF